MIIKEKTSKHFDVKTKTNFFHFIGDLVYKYLQYIISYHIISCYTIIIIVALFI